MALGKVHAQEERLRVVAEEQAARLDELDHEIAHERRTAAAAAARERSLRDELEAQHAREAVADAEAEDKLRRAGCELWIAGLNPSVFAVVERSTFGKTLGRGRMFLNMQSAVEKYQQGSS